MEDNGVFKLVTRRVLAWGVVFPVILMMCFLAVYGAITEQIELVTLAVGFTGGSVSSILILYFGKKISEE